MISKQKTITVEMGDGKKEFISNGWGPQKCFSNIPRIGKAFAVPLSMMMKGDEETVENAIPQALFMLFDQMEEQDVWELFQLIVSDVFVNPTKRVDLDNDLDNDLGAILHLVGETLHHNYGSLFSGKGLSSLMTSLMGVTQVAQV